MWLFFGIPVLVIFVMGVIHASESIEKIRLHWNEYRCDPFYIPFAGMIRPDIGVEENFQHCMNMFGQSIFAGVLDVINLMFKDVTSSLSEATGPLALMRGLMARIVKMLFSFGAQTFGKITNSMGSMVYILIKIRDILKRFIGEGYIATFLAKAGIDFIYGFVMLLIHIIKIFVYGLLAMSIILALFQPEILALAIALAALLAATGF
jgi:hypothetical protein